MTDPDVVDAHVVIEGVTYRRGSRSIFDRISLTVPRGKIVAIMGPSGTGKTTLLRLIGGQLRPDAGRVLVDGYNVPALGRSELFELRKQMGMLFQSGALFTDLSVFDNVAFPLRTHTNLSDAMVRDLVLIKLQQVGLRGAAGLFPGELSGGMSRRVALARAIALDPRLIMYDEPFAGLDPIAMGVVVKLIRTLNVVFGMTSVIVSHDVAEAASIADLIYLIGEGVVMGSGKPSVLFEDESPRIRQFIQGLPDGPVPFHYPAAEFHTELLGPRVSGR